ncbi:MAG: sulfurtransferase TusA family protein [Gammaproteobacteria bacterium]|nr:sulfurtransferase TusA family protein [Gammaproteobacteria bacterium]MCP5135503.1 sulfurtransferase TusA family protein [Gammaproteobacteria bacterium]
MQNANQTLDARGLNCPLPILRTRKSLGAMLSGEILELIATDPGSVRDIDAFCKQTGDQLLSTTDVSGEYHFMIRKA